MACSVLCSQLVEIQRFPESRGSVLAETTRDFLLERTGCGSSHDALTLNRREMAEKGYQPPKQCELIGSSLSGNNLMGWVQPFESCSLKYRRSSIGPVLVVFL